MWIQKQISLRARSRGCHLVTQEILEGIPELSQVEVGLLHVFIMHTSASLTLNENADPDVRVDLEASLNAIAPEDFPYVHTMEGPDDMPAHVKASLMGASVSVPVANGRLRTGTWQGIYLCEHRNHGGSRKVVLTLQGEKKADA
ncbi:MAG: secondary thiamine-phosphate synthase enzyme YjbQ [Rubinisphaera brasiliensis]|uniref:secondary thiamine-phosphate synthase enzyme YjbQ n=1 Tax=Rubinisphaera brasiliensis TaxID=119 RepID=UPI00391ADED8|nr:YjbQ family protein [bacterium]